MIYRVVNERSDLFQRPCRVIGDHQQGEVGQPGPWLGGPIARSGQLYKPEPPIILNGNEFRPTHAHATRFGGSFPARIARAFSHTIAVISLR